jgi:hypothetical protein
MMSENKTLLRDERRAAKAKARQNRDILHAQEKELNEVRRFNNDVEREHVEWQKQVLHARQVLETAENYKGISDTDALVLKPSETLYVDLPGGLVEDRVGQTQFVSGHQGISVPLFNLNGHAVRYNVGATRGHIVRPAPTPTLVDTGTVAITNQRIVFIGGKQTRECLYTKLVSIQHPNSNVAVIAVSNRQKPTVLHFATAVPDTLQFMFLLATADFQGTREALIASAQEDLNDLLTNEPKLKLLPTFAPIEDEVAASETAPSTVGPVKSESAPEFSPEESKPSKKAPRTTRSPASVKAGIGLALSIVGLVTSVLPFVCLAIAGTGLGLSVYAFRKGQGTPGISKAGIILSGFAIAINLTITVVAINLSKR